MMLTGAFIFSLLASSVAAQIPEGQIKHVVVVMLENRAFDHVFGYAQKELPGINGLTGNVVDIILIINKSCN